MNSIHKPWVDQTLKLASTLCSTAADTPDITALRTTVATLQDALTSLQEKLRFLSALEGALFCWYAYGTSSLERLGPPEHYVEMDMWRYFEQSSSFKKEDLDWIKQEVQRRLAPPPPSDEHPPKRV